MPLVKVIFDLKLLLYLVERWINSKEGKKENGKEGKKENIFSLWIINCKKKKAKLPTLQFLEIF